MQFTPVIGILALPAEDLQPYYNATNGYSYFPSTYVKWVESASARVVPIPYNISSKQELDSILTKVNGVMLPGGNPKLWQNEENQDSFSNLVWVVKRIFEKAIEFNDNGSYFPIWGTCLGYEMILMSATQNPKVLDFIYNDNKSMPINILNSEESDLFKFIPEQIKNYMTEKNAMYFNHRYGLLVESFQNNSSLTKMFKLIASTTFNNKEFVSILEGKQYPFTIVQYHPEINSCALTKSDSSHEILSILASQYQILYFISQAKKSKHRYDWDSFKHDGIQNYQEQNSITNDQKIPFPFYYVFQFQENTSIPHEYIDNFSIEC